MTLLGSAGRGAPRGELRAALAPVTTLLVSVAVLMMGNGLQTILIPVRAHIEGFSAFSIGVIGAAYFVGLTVGCLVCPYAVRRAGHIRSFAALAAIAAAAALLLALWPHPASWTVLRATTGFCFAGLWMVIEGWLNQRSTNATRGGVLSVYTIINLLVVMAGQQMMNLAQPAGFALFSLVAILICLAVVPVSLTAADAPPAPKTVKLNIRWLYQISPVAVGGCFVIGLANGAYTGLAPVYAAAGGLSVANVAFFMSGTVLGGALLQWPLGRWSDKVDRRWIIIGAGAGAALAGTALAVASGASEALVVALAVVYGGFALALYSLCRAHANDCAGPENAVAVSGGLLLVFSIGAIVGPILASFVMQVLSPAYLFAYTAVMHTIVALYAAYRRRQRAPVPAEEREPYVAFPRTSPAVFELNPRSAESQEEWDDRGL
jgi:MFS family permease